MLNHKINTVQTSMHDTKVDNENLRNDFGRFSQERMNNLTQYAIQDLTKNNSEFDNCSTCLCQLTGRYQWQAFAAQHALRDSEGVFDNLTGSLEAGKLDSRLGQLTIMPKFKASEQNEVLENVQLLDGHIIKIQFTHPAKSEDTEVYRVFTFQH